MIRRCLVLCLSMLSLSISAHVYAEESVCAVVKMEISQELTLERQGFEALMKISNKLDALPMENIGIVVTFKDDAGQLVTASDDPNRSDAKFFIRATAINGITGATTGAAAVRGGVLVAGATGEIHWLIVPAQASGGTTAEGKLYLVGATLSYTLGGEVNELQVSPDSIRVRPMPKLKLDYFLTREVKADDPMTTEIEPIEPFTLGIRIQNTGMGVGQAVKIESAQPKIVDNQQGLPLNFRIIGSYVNDHPVNPSLLINFGDIPSAKAAIGRWIMETTYSGTFTEFNASYSHASELGGELTSLLDDNIGTYLLVRDVRVDVPGRDTRKDFLAFSGDTLKLFESDRFEDPEVTALNQTQATLVAEDTASADHRYKLTFAPTNGFVHVKITDPYAGSRVIRSAYRTDGKPLLLDNVWISRTRKQQASQGWDYFINLFDDGSIGSYQLVLGQVSAQNQPPVIGFLPHQSSYETGTLTFEAVATDPDGQIPTLSASQLPGGATLTDQGNGKARFNWNPQLGQIGQYEVLIQASDGTLRALRKVSIQINSYVDQDGDGMLDAWEMEHFGSLDRDGKGDMDGDGILDLQEQENETDPTVPNGAQAPQIEYPQDYQEIANRQPQLIVKNSPKAQADHVHTYRFALYRDANRTDRVSQNLAVTEGVDQTAWQIPEELQDNHWYYWSAKVFNGYLDSPSVYGRFFVNAQNEAPEAARPELPADGATIESLTPVLVVFNGTDVDEDTLTYAYELYLDAGMTQPVMAVTEIVQGESGRTSWQVSTPLQEQVVYYWRAVVTDVHGLETASSLASFSINRQNTAPGRPGILSPQEGVEVTSKLIPLQATIAADPDGDTLVYQFELSTDAQYTHPVISPLLSDDGQQVVWDAPELTDNTRYYWRVKAVDPDQAESDWSFAQFFVNTENDAPEQPGIISPESQSWVDSLTPILEVYASNDVDQDALEYRFEIWSDANAQQKVAEGVDAARVWTSTLPLTDNIWYYWRARAEDEHGAISAWTELTRFFVNLNGEDDVPTINLLEPQGEIPPDAQNCVVIRWNDTDPDSSALISLFYSKDAEGSNRTLIVSDFPEDGDEANDSYLWEVSGLAPGNYKIHAVITDGNSTTESESSGYVVIDQIILTVDNDDAQQTQSQGNWSSSVAATGYLGSDYRSRVGEQPQVSDGIVLDNLQASVIGLWSSSTDVAGYYGPDYQYYSPGDLLAGGHIVDNGSVGFSARGNWADSTDVSGYYGANYQYHLPGQMPSSAIILDDTSTAFSKTGEWTHSTFVSGYEGAGYQYHTPNEESPDALIIDNSDASFSKTGIWGISSSVSGYWGSNYSHHAPTGNVGDTSRWVISLNKSVRAKVYARWTAHSNRATSATYTIYHRNGQDVVTVDQTQNGGSWQLLGTYELVAGTQNKVELPGSTSGYVIADAIRVVPEDASPNRAIWSLEVPAEETYKVYAKWTAHENRATNAQYKIYHQEGVSTVTVNQCQNDGQWQLLGSWKLGPNADNRVELSDLADGIVIADAIALVAEDAKPNTATWSSGVTEVGEYDVYARWTVHSNRASNAPYIVHHAAGQTTVIMNQQQDGGKWNLLGRFTLNPGESSRVELTDLANGVVIADAVAFVPAGTLAGMTWQIPALPETSAYEVYARWTAHTNRASDAEYTVYHASGLSTHTVNQKLNGSQWNLLGIYALDAVSRVVLKGEANGYVIGDGILLIPASRPGNDYQWHPQVSADGVYRISVRWPSANDHSEAANWLLVSGADQRSVTVNQRLRGGEWVELGELYIRADQGVTITLSGRAKGTLAADAVRLEYLAEQP